MSSTSIATSATSGEFVWSPGSFTLGISMAIDASTIITSVMLWRRAAQSKYYLWLALVALCHSIDLLLGNVANANMLQTTEGTSGKVTVMAADINLTASIASLFFAWIGGVGFVGLNMSRFYSIGLARMPKLSKVLLFLSIFSALLCTVNNALYVLAYMRKQDTGDTSFTEAVDLMFSAWSVFDALVNGAISLAFVTLLKNLGQSTGGQSLRRGFADMLRRVTWILGFECALIIAANALVSIAPSLDPLWSSIYMAESIRLRMFCLFLLTLSRMLKKKVAASSAQQPGTGFGGIGGVGGPGATSTIGGLQGTFPLHPIGANGKGGVLTPQGFSTGPTHTTSSSQGIHSSSGDFVSPL
ncbi:hypothetical protein H9P43_004918 [Blastocladiella emersonii ATCC 22665]|nr:hypothetical protein H9P43_004918 [Blastocladiella emersonii ATCC 22665]